MSSQTKINFAQIANPADATPELRQQLSDCWMTVANAGGAVGFAFPPVDTDTVTAAADKLIAGLNPRHDRLLLATVEGALAGWLRLRRDADPLVAHWGIINHLQTHPRYRGRGIGAALMTQARLIARDHMGLEQLRLAARGGEGLENFYSRLGWKEIGRWPNALRFHHGDRDEILMLLTPL